MLHETELAQSYLGLVSQDNLKSILSATENNRLVKTLPMATRRKLMYVIIECLQNIYKHGSAIEGRPNVEFKLKLNKDIATLIVSNIISNSEVPGLKSKLDFLSNLDRSALDIEFKKQATINEQSFETSGNAGLGLIEIARNASKKLEYYFSKVNEHHTEFELHICI
jgi:two-component sensor histidine kinase